MGLSLSFQLDVDFREILYIGKLTKPETEFLACTLYYLLGRIKIYIFIIIRFIVSFSGLEDRWPLRQNRGFEPRMELLWFEIYHERYNERKHHGEFYTSFRCNLMVCVIFPIRSEFAWEVWPKSSHSERRPVHSIGL